MNVHIQNLDLRYPAALDPEEINDLFECFKLNKPEVFSLWVEIERGLKRGDAFADEIPLKAIMSPFQDFISSNIRQWDHRGMLRIVLIFRKLINNNYI